jgi:hypothetical protein
MDNLMKLVTTALEWSYEARETEVIPSRLKSAAELLVLRHDTLQIIDGAGPVVEVLEGDGAEPASISGIERKTIQESEQQNTTKKVDTAKEQVQTGTSSKCTFSGVVAIDLTRFLDSGIRLVECPDCARTRSLSPNKGVLRFPSHDKRKADVSVTSQRWMLRETIWNVVGGASA